MSRLKSNKIYGGEMFKWEWFLDLESMELKIYKISNKIPVGKDLFTSSNGTIFRIYGSLGYAHKDLFDLPEANHCNTILYNSDPTFKKRLNKALKEFHEFCLKTYGSESEEEFIIKEEIIENKLDYFYHPYLRNISKETSLTESEILPTKSPEMASKKLVKVLEVINTIVLNGLEVPEVFIEKFNEFIEDYNKVANAR